MENRLSAKYHGQPHGAAVVRRPDTPRPAAHGLVGPSTGIASVGVVSVEVLVGLPTVVAPEHLPSPPKRARKQRAENWSEREVLALVELKRILTDEEENVADGRCAMIPDASKWNRISIDLSRAGVSPCPRDGSACKNKWNLVIQEFKRIVDFHARSGNNEMSYWSLNPLQRKGENLPRTFHKEVFTHIFSWYGRRPTVKPPHSRDLLSAEDSNYRTLVNTFNPSQQRDSSDEFEDAMHTTDSEDFTASTQSPLRKTVLSKQPSSCSEPLSSLKLAGAARTKRTLPTGVTPILLSSSNGAGSAENRRARNIGVRRKSISGHALIANATKSSGDAMTEQLKHMNDASSEAERNKISLQLKFFTEQMDYQLWRDERLQDNARAVNDNAKLAIEKQSELIMCLSQLSTVLSAGLCSSSGSLREPQTRQLDPSSKMQSKDNHD